MKIAIIGFALGMLCLIFGQIYKLHVLQNKVACLQEQVEKEWYLARHNVLIQNHNKRLNDKNIKVLNENFDKIEKRYGISRQK